MVAHLSRGVFQKQATYRTQCILLIYFHMNDVYNQSDGFLSKHTFQFVQRKKHKEKKRNHDGCDSWRVILKVTYFHLRIDMLVISSQLKSHAWLLAFGSHWSLRNTFRWWKLIKYTIYIINQSRLLHLLLKIYIDCFSFILSHNFLALIFFLQKYMNIYL
jgi:hypothetical protein